jgi:hypothetical protein
MPSVSKVESNEEVLRREEQRYVARVRRAYILMAKRLRVPRRQLEEALATRNVKKVMALFSKEEVAKVSNPLSSILRDALVKAGRIAEKGINR